MILYLCDRHADLHSPHQTAEAGSVLAPVLVSLSFHQKYPEKAADAAQWDETSQPATTTTNNKQNKTGMSKTGIKEAAYCEMVIYPPITMLSERHKAERRVPSLLLPARSKDSQTITRRRHMIAAEITATCAKQMKAQLL